MKTNSPLQVNGSNRNIVNCMTSRLAVTLRHVDYIFLNRYVMVGITTSQMYAKVLSFACDKHNFKVPKCHKNIINRGSYMSVHV